MVSVFHGDTEVEPTSEICCEIFILSLLNYCTCGEGCSHVEANGQTDFIQVTKNDLQYFSSPIRVMDM